MSSAPLEPRMGRLEGAYEQIPTRLNSIDTRLDGIDTRLDRMDTRLDRIDIRLDRFDTRLDRFDAKVDGKFDTLHTEVSTQFRWIVGLIFGTWVTTISAIFFHR